MRIIIKSYILIIGCILHSLLPAKAKNTEQMFFDNYNQEQGLIHSYILCMYQDSRGIMWVGTYGGVQAFNGYNFNVFNVSGKKSNLLTNHVVNVIFEDQNKNLWFGTESGLNKYNPYTGEVTWYLHNPNDNNSLSNNNVRTICQDKDGCFWIGTYGGGVNKLDEKKKLFTHIKAQPGNKSFLQSDLINVFFVDKDGLCWVGTENGGITVFDKDKKEVVHNFQLELGSLSQHTVNSIYQDIYDNIWVGTWDGGLNKFNKRSNTFSCFYPKSLLRNGQTANNIRCIIQTEKDFLWVSVFGEGLRKFDLKTEQFSKVTINTINDENSSQDQIWTMYNDNTNNLWLGTFGKGLFKQNTLENTFSFFDLKLSDHIKISIATTIQDKSGNLLIGTLNRGLYSFDMKSQRYSEFLPKEITNVSVSKLFMDSKNRIWVGADKTLYAIYPDHKRIRKFVCNPANKYSKSESSVNAIMEDKQGNIWVGFWGTGVNVIRNGELDKPKDESVVFTKYLSNTNDSFSMLHTRIWNFFEDSKGTIWIGTSGDLVYYTPADGSFKTLPVKVVSSFHEDIYGNLWLGSIGTGIYKLDKNKQLIKKYQMEDGLPCMDILSILTDRKGRLWMGTSMGLTVFDPRSESISNFDKYYGLQSFNINPNACIRLSSGDLFFGGNNGFCIFKPEDIGQDFIKSPIVITDIKINNKSIACENVMDSTGYLKSSVANLETLKLAYTDKVLTFNFAAVNFSVPSSISYGYMLEGFDKDWVTTTASNRSATYTNLDDGEYVFKVRMSYSNGKWSSGTRKIRIIVAPPFWKRLWFRCLLLLIVVSVIWLITRFKHGRKRLRMLISQKHLITEKLTNDQVLLHLKNDQLHESLEQQNKRMATVLLKHQSMKDELKIIYQNLLGVKSTTINLHNKQLNNTLQLISERITDLDETSAFFDNVNVLYDDFVKRFAEKYTSLTSTDMRICALIRMNKSNKEIAKQMNIALGSLETSRHRIRKKLSLNTDVNLNDFILRF